MRELLRTFVKEEDAISTVEIVLLIVEKYFISYSLQNL